MEKRALTTGEIARQLSCPVHRVRYLVKARNILPIERAGNLRIFPDDTVELLRAETEAICRNREAAPAIMA